MTRTPAPVCSWPKCSRKTRAVGGRCHQHTAGWHRDFTGPIAPPPSLITSPKDLPSSVDRAQDGSVTAEVWFVNGRLHRENGPAKIEYRGETVNEFYYREGVLHREDGPASISRGVDGVVFYEGFYRHGDLHRIGGPAEAAYYPDGTLRARTYAVDGVIGAGTTELGKASFHQNGSPAGEHHYISGNPGRLDGPADVLRTAAGVVVSENYRTGVDGAFHRIDGPAAIRYADDGSVQREEWYVDAVKHRLDGPADVYHRDNGGRREFFFFEDETVPSPAFIGKRLAMKTPEALRESFEKSAYAPLLDEGATPTAMLEAYRAGITSMEGMREVAVKGAPLEWYRAWVEGSS